jgi:hypothetical protein
MSLVRGIEMSVAPAFRDFRHRVDAQRPPIPFLPAVEIPPPLLYMLLKATPAANAFSG